MRLNYDLKAYCLCAMFGVLVPCSNAAASSVEILVDAALDESSLRTANEVALQVAGAAGDENSVGVVIFDEVFQRSTDLTVADDAHLERISQVFSNVKPSEFSNIAVGIEKGISELSTEGGVLLVFGNSDILLADANAVAKYSDWLELVLLPDAASKSIAIILAVPQNAPPSALSPIIQGFANNKVITFSDASDAINQLSLVLPFTLPGDTQELPVAVLSDQPTAVSSILLPEQRQEDKKGVGIPVLLTIVALLVLVVGAIIIFMLKRRRNSKHEVIDDRGASVTKESLSRYLAPKQGNTIVRTARASEADSDSTLLIPHTDESQGISGSDLLTDDMESELDVTAPRKPVMSNKKAQLESNDATVQRIGIASEDSLITCETGVIDELEELRNITQLKHKTQN
ncbi:hypothetical protein [Granulosicoccus antarcticus]|uniref:VWFA domain-containing protein n=1 Tax=Granulosicoccus antarcticus IMCC3135 TaxID=1192854 RepID=A0A2Z2P3C6_9GAMM|nr:hypothetical protein [Granulosicoccus antarcticus]ASJ74274.1 hypothetical protein IMCC3135_20985 [Granulosicoccus antarcticus IMCC3135]